ncbi:uncharacterized protein [Typha latifolia]|uniref:uncharacterized protein n=1 Tax=Typha latifolia TaxID=4733 RepID=UPI003C2C2807
MEKGRNLAVILLLLVTLGYVHARHGIEPISMEQGLGFRESVFSSNKGLDLIKKFSPEVDEKICLECRKAVKDIITEVTTPKMRSKIIKVILAYCEEVDEDGHQCKRNVQKYVPLILAKLDKMKANDLCRMVGICDEGVSPAKSIVGYNQY